MSATGLLKSLSDEQKAILAEKKVKLNRPADELLNLLKPIAAFDVAAAPARKQAGCSLAVLIVLSVIVAIYGLNQEGNLRTVCLALAGAFIVAAIVNGRTWGRLKGADVSDNLSNIVIPFLTILREDVAPAEPVTLDIDLTAADAKKKLTQTIEPKTKGYPKLVTSVFMNPWFEGNAVFADGTQLKWKVIDRLRVTKKTKKNPRGKIKTKTKTKVRSDVRVTMAFPTKRYAPKHNAVPGEKRHEVKLAKRTKGAADTPQGFPMLIDLIADGYRKVTSQKGAAR
ncbi:MAG: hypothetical protein QOI24_956 [Acidobacteriota bacterium]|jgi:hypothetical protein|nr:hypothetical protein [Acidobacteriota bacterium]